jgi:pilus assembly protein Flp/PilA
MMKLLKRVRVSKSGASAAEYALILAVIGGGIVVAAVALEDSISGAMGRTTATITTAGV